MIKKMIVTLKYLIGRFDPLPEVNTFQQIDVGQGEDNLSDQLMARRRWRRQRRCRSINVVHFEHEVASADLPVVEREAKTLVENGTLSLALHQRLAGVPQVRQQVHSYVPVAC